MQSCAWSQVLDFLFEYLGVAAIPMANGRPLELLLIRNLLDQRTTLRMLDNKIGEVTAVKGCAGERAFQPIFSAAAMPTRFRLAFYMCKHVQMTLGSRCIT